MSSLARQCRYGSCFVSIQQLYLLIRAFSQFTYKVITDSESHSVLSDSLLPHGLYFPCILQARILEWVAFPFSGDIPNPRIKPRSAILQADSSPPEPQGKPKNTGVSSLSLLQWIFPNSGIKLASPALQADSLPTELSGKPNY